MVSEHKISRCKPKKFGQNFRHFEKKLKQRGHLIHEPKSGFPDLITFISHLELRSGVFDNNILSSIEKNQLEFYKHEIVILCVTASTIDKSPSNIPT
jgi:hypothetical protein